MKYKRKLFGVLVPQCMQQMLAQYLSNLILFQDPLESKFKLPSTAMNFMKVCEYTLYSKLSTTKATFISIVIVTIIVIFVLLISPYHHRHH